MALRHRLGQQRVPELQANVWRSLRRGDERWILRAALVAVFRGLIIDRFTLLARFQMERRATVVAKPGTGRIGVVTEGALGRDHGQHPDAKIPKMNIALKKV
jgi:hypothetical protein